MWTQGQILKCSDINLTVTFHLRSKRNVLRTRAINWGTVTRTHTQGAGVTTGIWPWLLLVRLPIVHVGYSVKAKPLVQVYAEVLWARNECLAVSVDLGGKCKELVSKSWETKTRKQRLQSPRKQLLEDSVKGDSRAGSRPEYREEVARWPGSAGRTDAQEQRSGGEDTHGHTGGQKRPCDGGTSCSWFGEED